MDANIPINAMVMGYVAKAFGDMPEIAFNLMRPDLTKNATAHMFAPYLPNFANICWRFCLLH